MMFNDSRHLLPVPSMLFQSTVDLRTPLPTNATLVNINEAADTSVTALPIADVQVAEKPASVWHRMVTNIKRMLAGRKKKLSAMHRGILVREEKTIKISEPMNVRHVMTGGTRSADNLAATETTMEAEADENEWEDIKDIEARRAK
ncbi:hypothetical protein GQ44DRAFT_756691 [Phaeosphaeriaceae sp. PMI808]|nr:hypothetical protein GQ44DRAFT_756691 [Phaeosphaeriaceae sp. PMI808]